MDMRQPLPPSCRDTVTGNAFFHGCSEELTWFLEDKSGWVAGIAMAITLIHVQCQLLIHLQRLFEFHMISVDRLLTP